MAKTHTTLSIEECLLTLAKSLRINMSASLEKVLEVEIRIRLGALNSEVETIQDLALKYQEQHEREQAFFHQIIEKADRNRQEMAMMIGNAKILGMSRGEAETEFGEVFPDDLWESINPEKTTVGVSKGVRG